MEGTEADLLARAIQFPITLESQHPMAHLCTMRFASKNRWSGVLLRVIKLLKDSDIPPYAATCPPLTLFFI